MYGKILQPFLSPTIAAAVADVIAACSLSALSLFFSRNICVCIGCAVNIYNF